MSRSGEPGAAHRGEAQAGAPDLALVKKEMDAEEYEMSQRGQEQAALPDLSAVKREYEIDIEEHDLLEHPRVRAALQSRRGDSASAAPAEDSSVQASTTDRASALTPTPRSSDNNVTVEGIRIKIEENSVLDESCKWFSSKVVLRDCTAELQKSGRYCQECRVQFSSCSALADHMWPFTNKFKKHKSILYKYEKPFKCDRCEHRCAEKRLLTNHMRTHTGERPFQCNECEYRFAKKINLIYHLRTHTGERPFLCNQCEYSCAQRKHLVDHMRTHTGERPFQCNQCEYRCTRKSYLKVHMRIHTGERPFQCNQCEYRCTRKSFLIGHMKTHTGERPFLCNQCDYRCARRRHLISHMRTHTGKKSFKRKF